MSSTACATGKKDSNSSRPGRHPTSSRSSLARPEAVISASSYSRSLPKKRARAQRDRTREESDEFTDEEEAPPVKRAPGRPTSSRRSDLVRTSNAGATSNVRRVQFEDQTDEPTDDEASTPVKRDGKFKKNQMLINNETGESSRRSVENIDAADSSANHIADETISEAAEDRAARKARRELSVQEGKAVPVPPEARIVNTDPNQIPPFFRNKKGNVLGGLSLEAIQSLTPMAQLLLITNQKDALAWAGWKNKFNDYRNKVKKIGNGAFGEVFNAPPRFSHIGESVLKIVPFEPDGNNRIYRGPYHAVMQTAEEILPEVIISRELKKVANDKQNATFAFVTPKRVEVVKGTYPQRLIDCWTASDAIKPCGNTSPAVYSHPDQHYIIFTYDVAGRDLNNIKLKSIDEAHAIVVQVILAMIVAEKNLQMEHRDLHIGNILISSTKGQYERFKLDGNEIFVRTHGVKPQIIDFTLSRIKTEASIVYSDFNTSPHFFNKDVNPVYRQMRTVNKGEWAVFHKKTNLHWIAALVKAIAQKQPCFNDPDLKQKFMTFHRKLSKFECLEATWNDRTFFNEFYHGHILTADNQIMEI
ncbi:unnamed protein product [Caenorhabditis sp. 36 PRJEB53466]|nr:unnamed protein product [Caenorhabditis sp. 36 PRJEB53466]